MPNSPTNPWRSCQSYTPADITKKPYPFPGRSVNDLTLQELKDHNIDLEAYAGTQTQEFMEAAADDDSKNFMTTGSRSSANHGDDVPSDNSSGDDNGSTDDDGEFEFTFPDEEKKLPPLIQVSKLSDGTRIEYNPDTQVKTWLYPSGDTLDVEMDQDGMWKSLTDRLEKKSDVPPNKKKPDQPEVSFADSTPTKGGKRMASKREATPGVKQHAPSNRGRTTRSGARYNRLSSGSESSKSSSVRDVIKGFQAKNPESNAFAMVGTPSKGTNIDRETTKKNREADLKLEPTYQLFDKENLPADHPLMSDHHQRYIKFVTKHRLTESPEGGCTREEYQKWLDHILQKEELRKEMMKKNKELEAKKKEVAKSKVKERELKKLANLQKKLGVTNDGDAVSKTVVETAPENKSGQESKKAAEDVVAAKEVVQQKDIHTTHRFNFMDFEVPDDDDDDEIVVLSSQEYAEIEQQQQQQKQKQQQQKVKAEMLSVKKEKTKAIKQVAGQRKLTLAAGADYVGTGSPVGDPIVSGKTGIKKEDLINHTRAWKALAREVAKFVRELGQQEPALAAMVLEGGETMEAAIAEQFQNPRLNEKAGNAPVKPEYGPFKSEE